MLTSLILLVLICCGTSFLYLAFSALRIQDYNTTVAYGLVALVFFVTTYGLSNVG